MVLWRTWGLTAIWVLSVQVIIEPLWISWVNVDLALPLKCSVGLLRGILIFNSLAKFQCFFFFYFPIKAIHNYLKRIWFHCWIQERLWQKQKISWRSILFLQNITFQCTAWKVSALGVFLVSIFQHLEWIRRDTLYFSMFIRMRENADQKNCEYGHFSRIDGRCFYYKNTIYFDLFWTYSYWKINDDLFSLSTLLIQ